ncbi:hypothetical protein COOONC_20030 [Cooperia oncophora]
MLLRNTPKISAIPGTKRERHLLKLAGQGQDDQWWAIYESLAHEGDLTGQSELYNYYHKTMIGIMIGKNSTQKSSQINQRLGSSTTQRSPKSQQITREVRSSLRQYLRLSKSDVFYRSRPRVSLRCLVDRRPVLINLREHYGLTADAVMELINDETAAKVDFQSRDFQSRLSFDDASRHHRFVRYAKLAVFIRGNVGLFCLSETLQCTKVNARCATAVCNRGDVP